MNLTHNKTKTKISKSKFTTGFTLVEMMVAIAVFSIVMVTAMSALLNVIDANNKARALKAAVNNISFALEGISKDMRVGANYLCGDDVVEVTTKAHDGVTGLNCPSGGKVIGYRSPRAIPADPIAENNFAFYWFNEDENNIKECLEKSGRTCNNEGDFLPITSNEVTLDNVTFYVLGAQDANLQPRMLMTITGHAGNKDKIRTEFDLQTGVSQIARKWGL